VRKKIQHRERERERERAYLAVEDKPIWAISEKREREREKERFSYLSVCSVSTAAIDRD
jgi:hypothetical protein